MIKVHKMKDLQSVNIPKNVQPYSWANNCNENIKILLIFLTYKNKNEQIIKLLKSNKK